MLQTLKRKFPYFGRKLSEIEVALLELGKKYSDFEVHSELELARLKNKVQELEKENEFVLIQLFQAQSELDKPSPELLEIKSQFEKFRHEKNKIEIALLEGENEIHSLKRELERVGSKNSNLTQEVASSKKELESLNVRMMKFVEIEAAYHSLQREYEMLKIDSQDSLSKLQGEMNLIIATKEAELSKIETENNRLLKNFHKIQEDLESLYLENERYKNDTISYKARWGRLEQRLPSYIDFSTIRIGIRQIGGQDQVVWSVANYFKSGQFFEAINFATVLVDGVSGIGILDADFGSVFYPSLVGKSTVQRDLYLGFNHSQAQRIESAINVMASVLDFQWTTTSLDPNFDPQFWRHPISTLITDFRKLPVLLRINEVKLKLEVKNIDYENLWLELHDVAYGNFYAKKIELRVGASMVQPDGFSMYPKIEIPLVDGIEKPFSSWYAESSDTYGQKLEFRFDLSKKVMDLQSWAKLGAKDIGLCAALVNSLPKVLAGLRDEKIAIGREWSTWIEFASGAAKILNGSRAPVVAADPEEIKRRDDDPETLSDMPNKGLSKTKSKHVAKKTAPDARINKKVKKITVSSKK